jgi:molybdopterin-containing oxidoreductase family membrane subunit
MYPEQINHKREEIKMTEKKKSSWPFIGWVVVLVAALILGIWGASMLLIQGHGPTTGATDQVPWGIFVPTYIFFVAASAGCVIVSLGYALGMKRFELIIKRTTWLAIATLISGGIVIVLDLGSPLKVINYLLSPNLGSPLWWMLIFYLLYLVLLVVDFVLIYRGNVSKSRVISIFAALSAIAVHTTLGSIFGFASIRTFFAGWAAPMYFLTIAVIIGVALLLFITILQSKITRKEMSPDLKSLTLDLGMFLGAVMGITIVLTIWMDLVGLRSSFETSSLAYQYLLFGPGAWWYWTFVIVIGLIIPFALLFNPKWRNINTILVSSVLVLIGMFAARIEFVLGGQVVGRVKDLAHLQYPFASSSITFIEITIVILAFAISAVIYLIGNKKLALEEEVKHV